MGALNQLTLLLWKNWLQQRRSVWFAVFEVVVPCALIVAFLGLFVAFSDSLEQSFPAVKYGAWKVSGGAIDLFVPTAPGFGNESIIDSKFSTGSKDDCQFLKITSLGSNKYKLDISFVYSPKTAITDEIMQSVQKQYTETNVLSNSEPNLRTIYKNPFPTVDTQAEVKGFGSESEMVKHMSDQFHDKCKNPLLAGIVFDDSISDNLKTATDLKYKIRLPSLRRRFGKKGEFSNWDTTKMFDHGMDMGPTNKDDFDGGDPGYWREGFLTVQRAVQVAIIKYVTKTDTSLLIEIARFPFPEYSSKTISIAAAMITIIVPFCYMTSVIYTVRSVVMEKEDRLKEYMRVMGLSQFINWIAHFIMSYAKLIVSVAVMTFLLHLLAPKTDFTPLLLFLMIYAFNVVYVAFLVSTFLSSATVATMIAIVVWVLLFVWCMAFVMKSASFSFEVRLLNCLNPDIALHYGLQLMATYETQAKGLQWSQMFEVVSPDDPMTFGHALLALIVDSFVLIILTWYVEAVYPGGDGVPQKLWFFIESTYWFPYSANAHSVNSGSSENPQQAHVKLEPMASNVKPSINIVNLTKTYGASIIKKVLDCKFDKSGEKTAVSNLNFKIYPNQCTVLLGHNGAGKSTTFSVLTGVASPTKGTVYVNGFDIRNSLPRIRKQMGLCPQYNTLFSFMTVMEHLEFFAKLKERVWNPQEAKQILERLRIGFKANALSGTLSGGQKRKLSLAIALIGGSEIVMLDEPTSGMDPGARHETWTLIQQEKTRRTILLSTHFMEEADLLGDRIAVVAHGQLECCGSSMFLKKKFGDGYHLTIVYSMSANPNVNLTTNIIQSFIPGTKIYSHVGQEATFLLPAKYRPIFPKLFRKLEKYQRKCGISSFGTSITTLEEVFLKVNELAEARHNAEHGLNESHDMITKDDPQLKILNAPVRVTGTGLHIQHAKAMIYKRALYLFRTWAQFLPQFLFPVIYMTLIVFAEKSENPLAEQSPQKVSFAPFSVSTFPSHVICGPGNLLGKGKLCKQVEETSKEFDIGKIDDVGDVEKFIMESTDKYGVRTFGVHYPVAVQPGKDSVQLRAYFNNFAFFAPVLAISFADSLILSQLKNKQYTFTVTNHPLPPSSEDVIKNSKGNPFLMPHGLSVAFAVVVAGYAPFLITERKKKAKHMQFLSGVRPWMFWLCAFIWDGVMFMGQSIAFITVFFIFDVEELTKDFTVTISLFLAMLLYGWTAIPATYFFQFFFNSAPKGFTMITMYHILTQILGFIAILIVTPIYGEEKVYEWCVVLSLFFPTFTISNIANKIKANEQVRKACEQFDCDNPMLSGTPCCLSGTDRNYVDNVLFVSGQKGVLVFLAFLFCQGILFWTWVFMKEADQLARIVSMVKGVFSNQQVEEPEKTRREQIVDEDSDVIAEKLVVQRLKQNNSSVLVCENMKKRYGRFNAVKGVSFHVNSKNCFGLLGVNGAGKTSTFQMLTGENKISSGDAYVNGWSVKNNWREAGANIGYCPQYDAIIKELSGEETLYMYARIRGIPENELTVKVNAVIHAIGIGMYAKKRIETYSGGNKRRLSLGIALIGLPSVLLLDEPTSGVDPKARRIVWNILNRVRDLGTALVLTSHSMDECEALCTDLAIMIYGKFRCYGSCQHIKSRYGSGYTLLIRLKNKSGVGKTKQVIKKTFPGSKLTEEHILQLNYDVPRGKYTWSRLFGKLERVSQKLHWDDYSLSQTTLEQVFVEFSRNADAPPS